MNDIDKILKIALSPTKNPSDELNIKFLMKESGNMKMNSKKWAMAAAIILCILVIPATAYAAYQYLSPGKTAEQLDDKKLSNAFDKDGKEAEKTVTDGLYKVTYLGHVTGKSISERTGSAWELHPDRIYIAVAIDKANGDKMMDGDSLDLFISPLISGLEPWTYNIVSMNGSYTEKVINGTLYRIIECDNIEVFANKAIYLAVSDSPFYNVNAFKYDKKTGLISVNKNYKGTNVLFDLVLDSSKADPKKAADYLKQLQDEWNKGSDSQNNSDSQGASDVKKSNDTMNTQKELFLDERNKINIKIKPHYDNALRAVAYSTDYKETTLVYSYSLDVKGDNIDSLSFALNKGEFCKATKSDLEGLQIKSYGKKLMVPYSAQKDRKSLYSIYFKPKSKDYGYDFNHLNDLAKKNDDKEVDRIISGILNQEISSTKMDLIIKCKDGSVINKTITFKSSINEKGYKGDRIILSVK